MSFASIAYAKIKNRATGQVGVGYGAANSSSPTACDGESNEAAVRAAIYRAAVNADCGTIDNCQLIEADLACVNQHNLDVTTEWQRVSSEMEARFFEILGLPVQRERPSN